MKSNVVFGKDQLIKTQGYCDLYEGELRTLAAFVLDNERQDNANNYLEIGVFGGGTINFLKKLTKHTVFTGVDLFEQYQPSDTNTHQPGTYRRDDVADFLGDRVELIMGDSNQVVPNLGKQFNFIFIDGNHTYQATKQDFENCQHLLKPGGQIAFHNCSTHLLPDFDLYIKHDGGPWRLTKELIMSDNWVEVSRVERLAVFTKKSI